MSDAPVILPETVRFDLRPRDGGEPYRIFLRVPEGEPPEAGWPVLHLLDGNAVMATAVDALRIQERYDPGRVRAVLVGIGYPTNDSYDGIRRSWDLTPPPGRTYPPGGPGDRPFRTGGAERFLAFVETELKPEIARRVPADPARHGLFGHSFGGLFVLYALFTRSHAFAHWVAASPSIWWEESGVLRYAAGFEAAGSRPSGRVLLAAGEHEPGTLCADARVMAARLSRVAGVEAYFELVRNETHMSVLPAAVSFALRFSFGRWTGVALTGDAVPEDPAQPTKV